MAGHEDSDQLRIEALQEINAELLAALQQLLRSSCRPDDDGKFDDLYDDAVRRARAAIAKAKGE